MKIILLFSIITLLRFSFLLNLQSCAIAQEIEMEAKTVPVDSNANILKELNTFIETGRRAQDVVDIIQQHRDRETMPFKILLARAYVQIGLKKEAEDTLLDCFRDDPSSTEVTRLLGSYYLGYQRYNDAEKFFKLTMAMDDRNWKALAGLGKLYLIRDNDKVRARLHLSEAVNIEPNDADIQIDLAMVLFHFEDHLTAREIFQVAERLNPTLDHKFVAKIYLHYKHIDWAAIELRKIVGPIASTAWTASAKRPDTEAMLLLAECNDFLGLPLEAMAMYERVLVLEPHNALAHAGLGLMLLGTGSRNVAAINACGINQQKAMHHLNMALQLESGGALKTVMDAVEFCHTELEEVKEWRKILHEENGSNSTIKTNDVQPGNKVPAHVPIPALINKVVAASVKKLAGVVKKILIMVGICGDNNKGNKLDDFCVEISRYSDITNENNKFARRGSKTEEVTKEDKNKDKVTRMKEMWGSRESMTQIHRISIDNKEEFISQYMGNNIPVVGINLQNNWADSSVFTKKELDARFGSEIVRVSVSPTGRFDGPENGTLWGLGPDKDVLVRPPTTAMMLHDFFRLTSSSKVDESFYLEYLALNQYLGGFLSLIPNPFEQQISIEERNSTHIPLDHLVTNLWIGTNPTTSPLHYDDYENFLCQIKGVKELILFPPTDLAKLYYVGRPKGTLEYQYPSQFVRPKSSLGTRYV